METDHSLAYFPHIQKDNTSISRHKLYILIYFLVSILLHNELTIQMRKMFFP